MRRGRVALFAALLTATGGLAGCSGGNGTTAPAGTAGWLSAIPDTAAYRSLIAINDLRTLWTSAGLSFPPPAAHLGSGPGLAASDEIGAGSAIGSALPASSGFTKPLGYNPLAITAEVSAGEEPGQLSLVEGPIQAARFKAAMRHLGTGPDATGAVITYTYRYNIDTSKAAGAALIGVRHLAVLGSGGRAAAGGPDVPAADVSNLLRGSHPTRSLASDPQVRQTLGFLKGADVMLLGTGLILSWKQILGSQASAGAAAQLLRKEPGLDRLPAAPTFAGYGYLPGNPAHATALAVAIYPSASDAAAAARILGNLLRVGFSFRTNERYAQLIALDKITVHGDAVVARVTPRGSWFLSQAAQDGDFPLFWTTAPH